MKKFLEVLKNPVMTIFLWLLGAASEIGLCIQAVKMAGAPAIACVIMLCLSVGCLILRYWKGK